MTLPTPKKYKYWKWLIVMLKYFQGFHWAAAYAISSVIEQMVFLLGQALFYQDQ